MIVDGEYVSGKSNNATLDSDFESFIDLFDSERPEKNYDWMSDVSLPEFPAHMFTQSSIDVSQYFKTRDFIEAYLEDDSDEAKAHAEAAKECLNRTLNQRHIHHYQKYVRGKTINHLVGHVYIECWWEQKFEERVLGHRERIVGIEEDIEGNPVAEVEMEEIRGDVAVVDRFNYDILDGRNVFTNNTYTYTLQDKEYVIIRSEKTLPQLEQEKDRYGYDLSDIKDAEPADETETSRETTNKYDNFTKTHLEGNKPFDILRRYGKHWCKVSKNENGERKVSPGIDSEGKPVEGSELLEVVITYAKADSLKFLIGFHLNPYLDANNEPFRPIIKGLCYIHPTDDRGTGDGKLNRELQTAIDDTFNMTADRTKLATIPVFKSKKYTTEDNDDIYMEPGHNIGLENPSEDLQELIISDDIGGGMTQIAMLTNTMDKVMSIYPTTMGQGPTHASTTASAVAGAESRTDMRSNYKALTYENTAMAELYWMILQMTDRFAQPATGEKLMGDKLQDFDASKDYYYKPVSASIESDQSKAAKSQTLTSLIGYVSNLQHPNAVKLVNLMVARVFDLMGDEYANYGNHLLDEDVPIGQGQPVQGQGPAMPVSNQTGLPQTMLEQSVRS
jgi:hypothetical protein